MILLAIDTASALCAACVYDSVARKVIGRAVLELGKGHAEHLIGVVHDAMAQAGSISGAGRIVVAVGPALHRVRVGVSAARGFAMALKIPGRRDTWSDRGEARDVGAEGDGGARRRPRRDPRGRL
jgi:tRNA A37 threonylcarbamoyladenosine modification protein TsaB